MIQTLSSWLSLPAVRLGLVALSLVALVASVVLVPRILARLPQDYLYRTAESAEPPMLVRLLRNLLGVVLVLLGVAMLVLPGQGVLTMLVGLLLIDFPGKHGLVRRLLGRPSVLKLVNKLRALRGSPPLAA